MEPITSTAIVPGHTLESSMLLEWWRPGSRPSSCKQMHHTLVSDVSNDQPPHRHYYWQAGKQKIYKSRIPVFSQCFVNLFFVVFVEEFLVLYYSSNILYPPSFIFALLWIHLCDVAVDNGKKHPKHSLQPTLCDHPVLTKTRLPVRANIRFAILLKFKAFYSWDFFC